MHLMSAFLRFKLSFSFYFPSTFIFLKNCLPPTFFQINAYSYSNFFSCRQILLCSVHIYTCISLTHCNLEQAFSSNQLTRFLTPVIKSVLLHSSVGRRVTLTCKLIHNGTGPKCRKICSRSLLILRCGST